MLAPLKITIAALCLLCAACTTDPLARYQPKPYVQLKQPEWSKNATIYQINTRQFSDEGTFKAAETQLPRLKALGVDILWVMPIHPIGEVNRKGPLGSPYAVKDYFAVNSELGTLQDFKDFVASAHALDMKVIIDWVANHTACDNVMMEEHPEWYKRDYKGDFIPTTWWNWSDIIDLDYDQPAMRETMTRAMKYWVEEADIDGYRCDVAGFVPVDFWNNVRAELDQIKPVFMLAEWESRDLHAHAFNMSYAWSWYEAVHMIAHGKANVDALRVYYSWNENAYPKAAMRMTFVTNHDKNAWEGTQFEAFGDALPATIALSVVGEGTPLMYNGQEAGNPRRLAFFERDPIHWQPHPIGDLYKKLFDLKKANTALWNGEWGATMIQVPNNHMQEVLSFVRTNEQNKVFAVFNFSNQVRSIRFEETLFTDTYTEFGSGEKVTLNADTELELPAWGYKVYTK